MSGRETDVPAEKDDIAVQHKPQNATSDDSDLQPTDFERDHEDRTTGGPPADDD